MSWASLWRRSRITREPGGANEKRSVHLFRLQGLRSGASPELDKLAVVGADTVFLEQLLSDEAGATAFDADGQAAPFESAERLWRCALDEDPEWFEEHGSQREETRELLRIDGATLRQGDVDSVFGLNQ